MPDLRERLQYAVGQSIDRSRQTRDLGSVRHDHIVDAAVAGALEALGLDDFEAAVERMARLFPNRWDARIDLIAEGSPVVARELLLAALNLGGDDA